MLYANVCNVVHPQFLILKGIVDMLRNRNSMCMQKPRQGNLEEPPRPPCPRLTSLRLLLG
jgi:hypothetical protein